MIVLSLSLEVRAQIDSISTFCDSIIYTGVRERLIPGMGITIISNGSVFSKGYGLSDLSSKNPVTTQTFFQVGSIGKVFTAIAALQLVEQGKLNLADDIRPYLGGLQLENPFGTPITLFHLLTHTAGLNDQIIGYGARSVREIQPLEEHLKKRTPTLMKVPGTEINYSNYSYALIGLMIEKASGQSFEQYVRAHILEPLSMKQSHYILPDDYETKNQYAKGYTKSDTSFIYSKSYPRHPLPAGSLITNADEMTYLLKELLNPSGKLLKNETMQKLFTQQFTQHPLLMGYSLGLEEQRINNLHGWAKGGSVPGFLSVMAIFPDQQLAMFLATNTSSDDFFERFVSKYFDAFYPAPSNIVTNEPTPIEQPLGTYIDQRTNKNTIEEMFYLFKGRFDIWQSEKGYIATYHNGDYQLYQQTESPSIYQNQKRPYEYLMFQKDDKGVQRLYRNVNIGGFYVPVSLEKVAWYNDPTFINEYYFLVLVVIWLFILVLPFRLWIYFKRKKYPLHSQEKLLSDQAVLAAIAVGILYALHFWFGFFGFFRNQSEFFFGAPESFKWIQHATWILPFAVIWLLWNCIKQWTFRKSYLFGRIYLTLLTFAAIIHLAFLYRWHFLGLHV